MEIVIKGKHDAHADLHSIRATATYKSIKEIAVTPDRYDGAYEIEPQAQPVEVAVGGYYVPHNIIVKPIPNNYGKITWDGTTLTVS